jgi:hypothetical protein
MNIIELAKEAGFDIDEGLFPFEATEDKYIGTERVLEAFAALILEERDSMWLAQMEFEEKRVRADLMKQVMDTCEAEYKMYDKMIDEDGVGDEECCALIHLMRKLDRLRPATGKAEVLAEKIPEWVDVDDYEEPVKQELVANQLQHKVEYWLNHYDRKSLADMELLRKDVSKFAESLCPIEPVKQEPVAWRWRDIDGLETIQSVKQPWHDAEPLYAEPVDAKAIRAEALEEAAKVCEEAMIQMNYSEAPYKQCAAAIRGLK